MFKYLLRIIFVIVTSCVELTPEEKIIKDTLYTGDIILVNKLNFGPRLPESPFEIPWVNLLFYMNDDARMRAGKKWWDVFRLKGLKNVQRDDVVVFNFPYDDQSYFIKRCIGLPSDTLSISLAKIFLSIHLKTTIIL